jgi:hypothetical protein
MYFLVKAPPATPRDVYTFNEKTMYRGRQISPKDEIFIFASDHMGGQGLVAKGVVTSVALGEGSRVTIKVRRTALSRRPLGRSDLKPFCDLDDDQPQTEIARKFYRQATNKIGGISEQAARFLNTYF